MDKNIHNIMDKNIHNEMDKKNKNNDETNILLKEKIEACLFLSSYLDTVGFKNGQYEFKFNAIVNDHKDSAMVSNRLLNDFFILGGFNYFPIKNLIASDDTLLLLATTQAIIDDGGEINYIKNYLNWYPNITPKRGIGIQTNKSLSLLDYKFKKKKEESYIKYLKYDEEMGGNGAAIRTATIGIKWSNNIDKIIEESIIASRVTHNYYTGFLGGVISALFTSFAINNIPPWIWLDKLLEIHENNKIINYIHTTDFKNTIDNDIKKYFYYLYKYKEERLNDIITFRKKDSIIRSEFKTIELLPYNEKLQKLVNNGFVDFKAIGTSGLDVIIYAYESLLLSIVPMSNYSVDLNNPVYSWESLIYFTCLSMGDSDSIGAIAGAWFGALNGFYNIDRNKFNDLEFYNEIKYISEKLYKQL